MSNRLWTTVYRPLKMADVIGHSKSIRELKDWLKAFNRSSSTKHSPIIFLYGTSGIGKTTLANVILQTNNYHIYELNAGEIRSKKRITTILDKILNNHNVDIMRRKSKIKTTAILMDEIDGMSCGDKGGLHQLFQMVSEHYVKDLRVINPIICISNRPYEKKLPDGIYVEIAMQKPSVSEISHRLYTICQSEGVTVADDVLEKCVEHCSRDVRKAVTFVQELAQYSNNLITMTTFITFVAITRKVVLHQNLFEITEALFQTPYTQLECFHAYQMDPNLVPLMLHENLLSQLKHKRLSSEHVIQHNAYILQSMGLLSRIKHQLYTTTDTVSLTTLIPRLLSHGNLACAHSALCCSEINQLATIPCKTSKIPSILFTNSLTKSATYSTSHNFFALTAYKLNLNSSYLVYAIPSIVRGLVVQPDDVCSPLYQQFEYHDVDKIVQVYQKYCCAEANEAEITINPKCRRIWRKMKSNS
jgi:DNA polymerase III delta prime subunit